METHPLAYGGAQARQGPWLAGRGELFSDKDEFAGESLPFHLGPDTGFREDREWKLGKGFQKNRDLGGFQRGILSILSSKEPFKFPSSRDCFMALRRRVWPEMSPRSRSPAMASPLYTIFL